ncbi:CPSF A subunit region-domain-containing protein [Umbelopsis sp. PMI_123]|nr:CPSF A subunit region-domain-containing protein [Umbelopsis sp. PMI_123]
MSVYQYVVTAQKPTAVHFAVKGRFTSSEDINLIISKGTRIEIFTLTPEGLRPVIEFGIYGRIEAMEIFSPPDAATDSLFILTERNTFCILTYNQTTQDIVTAANGDVRDRSARSLECGMRAMIDVECKAIVLTMYAGLVKVLPFATGDIPSIRISKSKGKNVAGRHTGEIGEGFNIRIDEVNLLSSVMLQGVEHPTVMILYEDTRAARHVKTYEINLRSKDKTGGANFRAKVEAGANLLIAVPAPIGGALVIGEQTITHIHPDRSPICINIEGTVIRSYGLIDEDGTRILLADYLGHLYVLVLISQGGTLAGLQIERLGEVSTPSSIVYLDNGFAYIGSPSGDSQLVQLHNIQNEEGSYLEILEEYPNMAPITDFCIVDLERQGQGQLVTCSGAGKDGSLRIVRNGVGIDEQATLEMPGVKGLWSLADFYGSTHEETIVFSFIGETRVLHLNDSELEEVEQFSGFDMSHSTVACGNVVGNLLVQVTEVSVRLSECSIDGKLVDEWKMDEMSSTITVASLNATQCVLSYGNGTLVLLEVQCDKLVKIGETQLEYEIACIDISPFERPCFEKSQHVAVGLWTDISARILSLPEFKLIVKENLGIESIPRSILMTTMEDIPYLFVASGDGQLFSFKFDHHTSQLAERKKIALGTQPIVLQTFNTGNTTNIFAASDRPTVVYSKNQKLLYSNVNLKEVNYMVSFNSESFPNSVVLNTDESTIIGKIDQIQKLHVSKINLDKEMARRIAYQESSRTFGIITTKIHVDAGTGDEQALGFFRILDDRLFEALDSFALDNDETIESVISLSFEADSNEYYVVGTARPTPEDSNVHKGRLLVFSVLPTRHLKLVTELEILGAPWVLREFNGKLVAGINGKVEIFQLTIEEDGTYSLSLHCSHRSNVLALYIETKGDFILVGDLMESVSVLMYSDGAIEQVAKDYNANWMTSVAMIDQDTYIGSETGYNLFTLKRNAGAATPEERRKLEIMGEFHLGEFVNRFRKGSLVMNQNEVEGSPVLSTVLYGTINGAIGVIANITQESYELLEKLQYNLTNVIHGIGGLKHQEFRTFYNEQRTGECRNFIDGDLIETFLDLNPDQMQLVVDGSKWGTPLDSTVDDVVRLVEILVRIH